MIRNWRRFVPQLFLLIFIATTAVVPAQDGGPVQGIDSEAFVPQLPIGQQELEDRAVITSEETIRTEDNVAYAQGRTKVNLRGVTIEADRMVIDFITQEVQAEGNVIFESGETFIKATAGRFNLATGEGVAYGVDGQTADLFFRSIWDEEVNGPSFRQMSEQESVFRGTRFTTCEFPVPHYYIKASEVILHRDKRVFFRNPVLVVWGVPVFWLPWHTRSLDYGSPWSTSFGYSSDLGAFFRLGYRYIHELKVPGWEDPEQYETKSHGQLDATLDYFSQRGVGYGFTYTYQFDFNAHRGYIQAYGIRDRERDLDEEGDDDDFRWIYRHKHNTFVNDHWMFQLNIDEASDSDLYVDILDEFAPVDEFERGRLFETESQAAITYYDKEFIARILAEDVDRLGRDLYIDPADPYSDDLDFDPEPDFEIVEVTDANGNVVETFVEFDDLDEDGIPNNRWADVRENVYGKFATRLRNIENWPLYYRVEANIFDSLDSGYNALDDDDDERVHGFDVTAELIHRLRLGERTTWINAIGVGYAHYYREGELVASDDFLAAEPDPAAVPEFMNSRRIDGMRFIDRESILIGETENVLDVNDVDHGFAYLQYRTRLSHRFTQFLYGYVQYRIREGAEDGLGEFYYENGRVEAAEDIYDFVQNEQWVEAGLTNVFLYPNIVTFIVGRINMQGEDHIYANELLNELAFITAYANDTRELEMNLSAGFQTRQIRDPDDPNEFHQGSIGGIFEISYFPRHQRYWGRLKVTASEKLDDDPVNQDSEFQKRFNEEDTDITVEPTVGRQFGPKYRVELGAKWESDYDDFTEAGITVIRDLHDAELALFLGVENDNLESLDDDIEDEDGDDITRETNYELKVKTQFRFKIGRQQPNLGQRNVTTLSDLRRDTQYVR